MQTRAELITRACVCGREFTETLITERDSETVIRAIPAYCIPCTNNMRENQLSRRTLQDWRSKVINGFRNEKGFRLTIATTV